MGRGWRGRPRNQRSQKRRRWKPRERGKTKMRGRVAVTAEIKIRRKDRTKTKTKQETITKKSNEKKARRGNDGKEEKMVGSLSGIATMLRSGDVTVVDEETHKVVTSEFSVGPLQLQVSKIYGRGKARTVK